MKALCNNCQEIVDVVFEKEIIDQDSGGDVIRNYVQCPNCGYKVTHCISDSVYSAMQAYCQQLTNALHRAIIQNQPQVKINAIANKQQNYIESIIKPYQKQLREKYDRRSDENADKESIPNSEGC